MENHTGRFAPSPTGPLHLGNLRTALLAWLYARSQGGRFLLRIEDLDTGRSRREHEHSQIVDLRDLGIDWDEPGERQSERGVLYSSALARLDIYPCWCTRAEIREAASAPHGNFPEGAYPGTCRDLSPARRAELEAEGRPPALRVRAGSARVVFDDRLHGQCAGVVDDFVVRRNDGAYAYNLAVVVDDGEQGVGEIVRGDDLLDSAPRQIWLGRQLGIDEPSYTHVPLVLASDGTRLSKRHGAVTLADRAQLGESAQDVLALLGASLGLSEPGERPTTMDLLARFDADAFRPLPAETLPGV